MKKVLLLACFFTLSLAASAQLENLSVGINGNYTTYKGDVQKSTPGAQFRIGYNFTEKYSASLGFTYGFPIKESFDEEDVAGKAETKFSTISLMGAYHLIGTTEDPFSLYFPVGASYVMVSGEATMEGVSAKVKDNGLTLNGGIGAQFQVGLPVIFAEAAIALPAGSSSTNSREGVSENPNPIPFHTILNLGVKIPLGRQY
jgi:opacity protein-like surface antigen